MSTATMTDQIAREVIRTRVCHETHLQAPRHPRTARALRTIANRLDRR